MKKRSIYGLNLFMYGLQLYHMILPYLYYPFHIHTYLFLWINTFILFTDRAGILRHVCTYFNLSLHQSIQNRNNHILYGNTVSHNTQFICQNIIHNIISKVTFKIPRLEHKLSSQMNIFGDMVKQKQKRLFKKHLKCSNVYSVFASQLTGFLPTMTLRLRVWHECRF